MGNTSIDMSWASQAKAGASSWADDAEEEEQLVAEGKEIAPISEYDETKHQQSQKLSALPSAAAGGSFADVEVVKKELPPNTESFDEATGIKTLIEYKLNGRGQRVKVTKKIKVESKTKQLRKRVMERRSWTKFGHAYDYIEKTLGEALADNHSPHYQGAGYEEEGVTFFPDPVFLDLTPKAKVKKEVEVDDGSQKVGSVVVCRICGMTGDHWTLKCPNKEKIASGRMTKIGGEGGASLGGGEGGGPGSLGTRGKYVPPSLRNGDGTRMLDTSYAQRDDSNTLRVSNLSEETGESDLQELFRSFGPISRTYLAKDRETQASRGFAFVTFMRREDAQRAMDRLAGYGYDHLILQIEWAQPSPPK